MPGKAENGERAMATRQTHSPDTGNSAYRRARRVRHPFVSLAQVDMTAMVRPLQHAAAAISAVKSMRREDMDQEIPEHSTAATDPIQTRPRILAADDDEITRDLIAQVLDGAEFEVITAADGEQALRLFDEQRPDLVLLDVMMPRLDGYETCRAIRKQDSSHYVPVLMLTALDDVRAINRAFECGATDFITKPINWPLFTERIRYALRGSQLAMQLKENQERLEAAHRVAKMGHFEWDAAAQQIHCSPFLAQLLGIDLAEFDGSLRALADFVPPEQRAAFTNLIHNVALTGRPASLDHRVAKTDGGVRYVYSRAEAVIDRYGRPGRVLGIMHDVTERMEAEQKVAYLSQHDGLTGLANRSLFQEKLRHATLDAQRRKKMAAAMLLDLDRFKEINESFGHDVGDTVLKTVADRLLPLVRKVDTLAHLSGDEFAMTVSDLYDPQDVSRVAQRIMSAFRLPFVVAGQDIYLSASIGIALYPIDGQDVDALMKNADSALHSMKALGRRGFQFYRAEMNHSARERLTRESRLHSALDREEFLLCFQPQVDIVTGRVHGVEALLRWRDGQRGIVSPDEFIPILEQSGLIVPVGEWALQTACRWAKRWHTSGHDFNVSVNLSARQFCHPQLVDSILQTVQESAIDNTRVELELTESTLMSNASRAVEVLGALKEAGLRLAIDDFGTGYSSLAYLKKLPVDYLKVDKSFVIGMAEDSDDHVIVRSTVDLAHNLGLKVVAEGVESIATLSLLKGMGCDIAQGFVIARPLDDAQFDSWLKGYLASGSAT
jgi:diguanylate cyclase (GGDEF)-like protein/PAS domain S-box-containing protein